MQCVLSIHRECHGQMAQPAQQKGVAPARRRVHEAQSGQAAKDRRNRDLRLQPRQWSADTVVNAAAEAQVVSGVGAADVEAVRLRETLRVAVGGAKQQHDAFAALRTLSTDPHVVLERARGALHRRVKTQDLLHGVVNQRWLVQHSLELARMAQQSKHAVADQD